MADDTTQAETQGTETEAQEQQQTTSAQTATQGATFTQADVDRILAERLSRDRKQQQEEAKKLSERAKLDAEQRLAAEKADVERERDEARQTAKLAGYRADLKGEVIDTAAALKLVDDEKHVKNGAVDVKALLKDYPFLAPQRSTGPGAGGVQGAQQATGTPGSLAAALAADGINLNG